MNKKKLKEHIKYYRDNPIKFIETFYFNNRKLPLYYKVFIKICLVKNKLLNNKF